MITREDVLEYLNKRKKDIFQWSVVAQKTTREENYLVQDAKNEPVLEQNRNVEIHELQIELSVPTSGDRIGTATADLNLYQDPGRQIDKLIERAYLATEEIWTYPKPNFDGYSGPRPKTFFEGFKSNLTLSAQIMVEEVAMNAKRIRDASFNSAELFCSLIETERDLSSGFKNKGLSSKIYAEVCFSAENDADSNEFLVTRMGSSPQDLIFSDMCKTSSSGAQALLSADKCPGGNLAILIDAETVAQIFSDSLTHINAQNQYFQLPYMHNGTDFIPQFGGDAFELTLDPTLDYGFASHIYTKEGWAQEPKLLIKDNKIINNIVSEKMAQYLQRERTISDGNIVLTAKGSPYESLVKEGQVLEVLQFSALFCSPQDLTFSSELRLGRLWENGKARYVRGGNVSGSFKESFKNVRFSNESLFRNLNAESLPYQRAYKGPKHALLHNVTVTS
jgi:predicted Zn-dependent protease